MLVAPLISRWSQAQPIEPMCMGVPALSAARALHAGHRTQPAGLAADAHSGAVANMQHARTHDAATHGHACDYCVLAARLLPLLIVALLCLLQPRPAPAPVLTQAGARSVFDGPHSAHVDHRWPHKVAPVRASTQRCPVRA